MKRTLLIIIACLFFTLAKAELTYAPAYSTTYTPNLNVTLSELNLARELLLDDTIDMVVVDDSSSLDFYIEMTKRLNELGWNVNWQNDYRLLGGNQMITSYYKEGGHHLRLEVTELGKNKYQLLLYQF